MVKILLVDDDPDEFQLLEVACKNIDQNVEVILAECCNDILTQFDKHKPDIIFMDINLPGLTGIEWLKLIRSNIYYKSMVIFMYSTSGNQATIMESYNKEANFYIVKPGTMEGLVNILRRVLQLDYTQVSKTPFSNFVIAELQEST